jgi:hypothetical protein
MVTKIVIVENNNLIKLHKPDSTHETRILDSC